LNDLNIYLFYIGITDIQGHFHLIATMITSNETEEDFLYFYRGIKALAEKLDLSFEPKYLLQDAQRSSYNAVKEVFPDVKVLMCWYHVKTNLRKHRNLIDDEKYEELLADFTLLHYAKSETNFEELKIDFELKYATKHPLIYKYINDQWFEGVFNQ